jgi:hypothetical protein
MNVNNSAATLVAMLALSACATPQAALDEANNGAGLIAHLELSLTEFRRVETNAENARLASLRDQQDTLDQVAGANNAALRARKSAGDTDSEPLVAELLANADAIAADHAAAQAATTSDEAALAALLQPLPSTKSATADAQKKLAAMGTDLSRDTRDAEFLAFAKAIKDNVAANKKKIAAAEAAANAPAKDQAAQ